VELKVPEVGEGKVKVARLKTVATLVVKKAILPMTVL
jgi:hypothetical protein